LLSRQTSGFACSYVNRAGKNFPVFIPYGKKLTERSENAKVRRSDCVAV
jgi:hypothetical protein